MTIQQAAYEILKERRTPLTSREIAKIALERKLVSSTSRDPVSAQSQTIEKNIREDKYNIPKLIFTKNESGQRLIGLPEWEKTKKFIPIQMIEEKKFNISVEDAELIQLAQLSGIGRNESEAVSRLIREGFKAFKGEIEASLMNKVKKA